MNFELGRDGGFGLKAHMLDPWLARRFFSPLQLLWQLFSNNNNNSATGATFTKLVSSFGITHHYQPSPWGRRGGQGQSPTASAV